MEENKFRALMHCKDAFSSMYTMYDLEATNLGDAIKEAKSMKYVIQDGVVVARRDYVWVGDGGFPSKQTRGNRSKGRNDNRRRNPFKRLREYLNPDKFPASQ